jgi:hypothetical protein
VFASWPRFTRPARVASSGGKGRVFMRRNLHVPERKRTEDNRSAAHSRLLLLQFGPAESWHTKGYSAEYASVAYCGTTIGKPRSTPPPPGPCSRLRPPRDRYVFKGQRTARVGSHPPLIDQFAPDRPTEAVRSLADGLRSSIFTLHEQATGAPGSCSGWPSSRRVFRGHKAG